MAAVEPLIEAHLQVQQLRQQLEEAEATRESLRAAAVAAGWTESELTNLDLSDKPKRKTRAPRRTTARSRGMKPAAPAGGDAAAPDSAADAA